MTNGNIGAPEIFPIEGTLRGREEAKKSHKVLGIKDTFFYDFPAPRLETQPSYQISIALDKLIRNLDKSCVKIFWRQKEQSRFVEEADFNGLLSFHKVKD